jgi:hypothetical protein
MLSRMKWQGRCCIWFLMPHLLRPERASHAMAECWHEAGVMENFKYSDQYDTVYRLHTLQWRRKYDYIGQIKQAG